MKRIILVGLVLICFSRIQAQERKLFWDGDDWRKIDHVCRENPEYIYWVKSAYLSGLFDSKNYYQLNLRDHDTAMADSVFADMIVPDDLRFLIAGLDAFYKDSAIRYLPIPLALIATKMSQQDYSKDEIETYIKECQDWINHLTLEIFEE